MYPFLKVNTGVSTSSSTPLICPTTRRGHNTQNATVNANDKAVLQSSSATFGSGRNVAEGYNLETNSEANVEETVSQHQIVELEGSTNEHYPSNVICIGNPGVGKSTILNTLIGDTIFRSGPSLGRGLTRVVTRHEEEEFTYVDTPGLDDISCRAEAASRIESLLSSLNGWVKLLFVVTLEGGRVRSGDLATVDLILSALKTAGFEMENRYSVIVNKCENAVFQLFESYDSGNRDVHAYFNYICKVRHFAALPVHGLAVGECDVLLPFHDALLDFVRDAPSIRLRGDAFVSLNSGVYEGRKEQLEREMGELRDTLRNVRRGQLEGTARVREHPPRVRFDMNETVGSHTGPNNAIRVIVDFVLEWLQSKANQSMRTIRIR